MQVTRQLIDTGWRVREVAAPTTPQHNRLPWLPARVPGHVHLDLMRAGVIPDPFQRLHERDVAWVAESDWEYETTFTVADPVPSHAHLLFHGLDTVAEITLNGEPLGTSDNMFVAQEFPVGGRLRAGENHLSVTFRSALRVGRERLAAWQDPDLDKDKFPGNWDWWAARSFVRKAQYMYGWDWGPVLPSCGLWRSVELVTVPTARLGDWKHSVEFTADGDAVVTIEAEVERSPDALDAPLTLRAAFTGVGYLGDDFEDALPAPVTTPVSGGSATASIIIHNPRRWNPLGLNTGTQSDGSHPPLYTLELSLSGETAASSLPRLANAQEDTSSRLGDILVEREVITAEQLRQAHEVQKSAPGGLGSILQDLGFAYERDVVSARASEMGLQFVNVASFAVDAAAIKSVPKHVAQRYSILPIKRDGNRLMVATSDPSPSAQSLEDVRLVSGCQITPVLAARTDLATAIDRAYGASEQGQSGSVLDKKMAQIGLRTVELIREPDADGKGEGFKFRVNGSDVFIKGANWIPEDSFPSRLMNGSGDEDSTGVDRVRERIGAACSAGFNMLRIWGGGLYESEHFYELCDAHGILVWQDFPYGCAYYPDTGAYADAGRAEATAAVKRIRNHASLALWCGNNENQTMYDGPWGGTRPGRFLGAHLYFDILPAVVAAEDPKTPYWPSSPFGGPAGDSNSADYGDCHNWDVWHGRGDWTHYTENDSRFCSEFGFAASCGLRAWDSVLAPEDRHPLSPAVRWHDKTRKGYDTYLGYIGLHFPDPQTLEDLVYYSQINQAEALKYGVEHYRRRKGRCWGTLFWQLNDCWPVQSWAIIDSVGDPRAAYYACRKFYAPVLVSLVNQEGTAEVHLVSDRMEALAGTLTLTLQTFDGETVAEETHPVSVGANTASVVASFATAMTTGRERDLFLHAQFASDDGRKQGKNFLFFAEPKDWHTSDPGLEVGVTEAEGETLRVTLSAHRFAPYVWLRLADNAPLFPTTDTGDNFFHLRPGETRELSVPRTDALPSVEALRGALVVRTL